MRLQNSPCRAKLPGVLRRSCLPREVKGRRASAQRLIHPYHSLMAFHNGRNNRPAPQRNNSNSGHGNAPRPGGRGGRPRPASAAPVRRKEKEEEDGEAEIEMEGVVSAVLAGTMFRVRVANGHEFLAHISGKMRKRFIRLVVGDRVRIEVSPYDTTKARITFRLN